MTKITTEKMVKLEKKNMEIAPNQGAEQLIKKIKQHPHQKGSSKTSPLNDMILYRENP